MLKFVVAFLFACSAAQSDNSFDVLMLAQSWPQTSCWNLNNKWPSGVATCSECKMPMDKNSWTVHGLWPSNRSGKHPSDCNKEPYDPKLLSSSLRTTMEEKWPTFNMKMSVDAFWSHEWSTHGTCAMQLKGTSTLPEYFEKTIEMIDQYNIGTILTKAGIVSGKKYKQTDIFAAIEKALGVKTYIKCATNPASHEQYIQEVHVCFDKNFKLDNCDDQNKTNCKSDVMYPTDLDKC